MRLLWFCHICQKPIVDAESSDAPGSSRTVNHLEFEAYLHMRDTHDETLTDGMPLSCERFEDHNAESIADMFHDYQERHGGAPV